MGSEMGRKSNFSVRGGSAIQLNFTPAAAREWRLPDDGVVNNTSGSAGRNS